MNDVVHLACEQACARFGGNDSVFNAAGFSKTLARIAGVSARLDGKLVRAVLCGRSDIAVLTGGSHFRLSNDDA